MQPKNHTSETKHESNEMNICTRIAGMGLTITNMKISWKIQYSVVTDRTERKNWRPLSLTLVKLVHVQIENILFWWNQETSGLLEQMHQQAEQLYRKIRMSNYCVIIFRKVNAFKFSLILIFNLHELVRWEQN
jgi:hypothetical protein